VFSVTTDGFLSNANDDELENATSGDIFRSFSKARSALEADSSALEVKHEIKRPIGWRTRGSATLEAGDGANNNILLQKGGIKVDANFDLNQENSFIINLFLNRDPGQQLEYTIGIGLKDMIVRRQRFSESLLVFVTEALVRFLFQIRRRRLDAATDVC
jgi:hypothetical protein